MLLCFTQTCHSEKCNSRSKQTTLSKSQSVLPKQISHTNHKFCATIIASIIGRSRHKYHFCHDNFFVATSLLLSQQTRVCSNKRRHLFATKVCLLRQISVAMNTNTSICCEKSYVIIKIFCHDKTFVATKMILVTAPANDMQVGTVTTHHVESSRRIQTNVRMSEVGPRQVDSTVQGKL